MGFWNSIFGNSHTNLSNQAPTRPVPPIPAIKPMKEFDDSISEPVLSIIDTLKNGEWDIYYELGIYAPITAKHEWFGNTIHCRNSYGKNCESWMTRREQEVVYDLVLELWKKKSDVEAEKYKAQQRASFMCLVPKTNKLPVVDFKECSVNLGHPKQPCPKY